MSKTKPVRDQVMPLTWEAWDLSDTLVIELYQVTFLSDFGKFLSGEELENLTVDYEKGKLVTYDDEGAVVREQRFAAAPLREGGTGTAYMEVPA